MSTFHMGVARLRGANSTSRRLILMIAIGILMRIALAMLPTYGFDMKNFIYDAELFRHGKMNVYLYQPYYNYSPLTFYIVGTIGLITRLLHLVPYYVLQRFFASSVDIVTVFLLIRLSVYLKISTERTVAIFFLNPLTVILSAYLAHFDNLAMLTVLVAIVVYKQVDIRPRIKRYIIWFSVTLGLLIKHIILFQALYLLLHSSGHKKSQGMLLFVVSIAIFLLTLLPFYSSAKDRIVNDVLMYSGQTSIVGVTAMLYYGVCKACKICTVVNVPLHFLYKYLFVAASIGFVYYITRHLRSVVRGVLLSVLFFLSFSPGLSPQYFTLPLALGAIYPSRWFILYSVTALSYVVVMQLPLGISVYKLIPLNVAWICTVLWFAAELRVYLHSLRSRAARVE